MDIEILKEYYQRIAIIIIDKKPITLLHLFVGDKEFGIISRISYVQLLEKRILWKIVECIFSNGKIPLHSPLTGN